MFIVVQKVPNIETIIALLFCHPAYLTYMQSTSCDMSGWRRASWNKHLPGSSPGGSRVIRRWGQSQRLWKNTYLITDIGRLEMDTVVGRLVEKKRLNNLDYVE